MLTIQSNGISQTNGKRAADGEPKDPKKRLITEDGASPAAKKVKNDDDVVIIDDDAGTGAIEILD